MGRKPFSAEFRAEAVELYRVTDGASVSQIAQDLGCSAAALYDWLAKAGVTLRSNRNPAASVAVDGEPETMEAKVVRLLAENEALRADKQRLAAERDILRKAAKYFAGETNW